MKHPCTHGPRLWSGVIFLGLVAFLGAAGGVAAQERPPLPVPTEPDTLAADTAGVVSDSVPVAVEDTLPPLEALPELPAGDEPGWRRGVWEWDRTALLESAAVTLTDLLERVPGVTPVRSGYFGASEAASAYGLGAGRIELVLDGFVLDPLEAGTFDLARLELAQLERVRIERRLGAVRIEVETLSPSDHRPYTMVEAGTGALDANVFRGIFLAPRVLGGPIGLGIDRVESRGLQGIEPANTFTGWLKWGLVSGKTGLEVEMRRSSFERAFPDSVHSGTRQDWILRARTAPVERLTAEAFLGLSAVEDEFSDTFLQERGVQGGVRAGYRTDRAWANSTVRLRSSEHLPGAELELAGGVTLPVGVHLSGDVSWADWRGGQATALGVRAEAGPFWGVQPFAEASFGTRGVPNLLYEDDAPVLTDRTAYRAGADVSLGGLHLGVAGVLMDADSLADFGLPFDRTGRLYPGGEIRGVEMTGRVPLFWAPLSVEGWYTRWTGETPWLYLPNDSWRAALVYRHSPMESGSLDLLARLEASHRGPMSVPAAHGLVAVPGMTTLDLDFQIRVLDVRAFIRWNNITHQLQNQDLPGRMHPGQRIFYGVKWQFWN